MKISTPQRSLVQMAGNINLMNYSIRSKGLHRNCNQWWKHVNWNTCLRLQFFLLFSTTIFIVLWPFVIWSELFTTKYIQKRYWCSWSESTPCDTKKEKSTPYGFKMLTCWMYSMGLLIHAIWITLQGKDEFNIISSLSVKTLRFANSGYFLL